MAETECYNGYFIRYIIKQTIRNNTYIPVITVVRDPCPVDQGPRWAIAFLAIIFIITFILSMVIVISIAGSFTLKKQMVFHLVTNLCLIVMVDCLFNLTFCISYIASAPWNFGEIACYFSSFSMTFITLEMGFGIFLLAIDRLLVAKKNGLYMSLSRTKMRLIIVASWIVSFALASPLVCGFIMSVPYRNRYSCSVCDPFDIYYLIPQIGIFIIIIPIIVFLCALITSLIFYREQKRHRKMKRSQTFNFFDRVLMTPYYKNEAYASLCVVALSIMYLVFWVPFHGVVSITPYFTNDWENLTTPVFLESAAPRVQFERFDFNQRSFESDLLPNNVTTNGTDISSLVPEVLDTPGYETAFIWFRFVFDILVPIAILLLIRDVRQKCRALVLFCRPNTVDSSSPKMISPPYLNASVRGQTPKDKKHKNTNMVSFKTPVLFATSEGLHVRTVEDTMTELNNSRSFFKQSSTIEPQFTYDLCDVSVFPDAVPTDFENDDDVDKFPLLNIDKTFNDPVVERAHRNAIGQDVDQAMNRNFSAASMGKRPPTPPKRRASGQSSSSNSSATQPYDMIEIDLERKPNTGNKIVHFNTKLNEEIGNPKTNTSDSALDSSMTSGLSNDSGNFADIEGPSLPRKKVQQTKLRKRPTFQTNRSNTNHGHIRNHNSIAKTKQNNLKKQHSKKPAPSIVGKGTGQNHRSTDVRKIKSRHMLNDNDSPMKLKE